MIAVEARRSSNECRPGGAIYAEVLEFMYREADLLDGHRYADWLALFADDVLYEMPVRTTQYLSKGPGFEQQTAFFDDNIHSLRTRVRRLETDTAWADTPPSRARHFVCNLLVAPGDAENEFVALTNFFVTRTRGDQGYQLFTGRREDILRRLAEDSWRIAKRRILVDQTVLTATNLSILF
jgi:3-phenylpropionate/cinnamic acid dioxygenase small subunit